MRAGQLDTAELSRPRDVPPCAATVGGHHLMHWPDKKNMNFYEIKKKYFKTNTHDFVLIPD